MIRNICKKIVSQGGALTPLIIPSYDTNGTGLMNPSIFLDGDDLVLNLRHVNYTLYHSEGEQLFQNRYGPLAYLNPENDIHLRTNNFLCGLNENLTINTYTKVDTSKLDVEPVWEFVGLEDARLVRWDNKMFMCGVRRDTKTNGEGRMELSEIVSRNGSIVEISRTRIEPPVDKNSYCEKNWMPVIDMPYHFIKWTNPTELVKVDIKTKTSSVVHLSESTYKNINNLRGSSQVIPWMNYRICVVHEVDLFNNKLGQKDGKYTHRFVVWDKNWNIVKITESFSFLTGEIEFACGMCQYKNDILITFGFQDNAAFLLKIPQNVFKDIIGIDENHVIISDNNNLLNDEPIRNEISFNDKLDNFPPVYYITQNNKFDIEQFLTNNNLKDSKVLSYDNNINNYNIDVSFANQLDDKQISLVISNLNAIKQWYYNSDSKHVIIMNDGVNFDTIDHWNFKWDDVINNLPKDWKSIQLNLIKNGDILPSDITLHLRKWDDWSANVYLITRDYAKEIIDTYCNGDKYILKIKNQSNLIPFIENVLFLLGKSNVYTLPIFSIYGISDNINEWWKKNGKLVNFNKLLNIQTNSNVFNWGEISENKWFLNTINDEIFIRDTYQKFFKVEKGDIVLDIGASVGPFTYSILSKKPKHVYCFEPHKGLFETLKVNVNSNNVTLINKGISNEDGLHIFNDLFNKNNMESSNNSIEADSIKFNTFIKEYNIEKIDFLKTDCEGGEYDIFTSENFEWIKNNVKKIVGEFHLNNEENVKKFKKFRDLYLKYFKNYEVYSYDDVDIKWDLWNEHFTEYYKYITIYINNTNDKNNYWKSTDFPVLEVTTTMMKKGCVVDCVFCPQRTITESYNGEMTLTLDNFKKVVDKLPKEVGITFAGFSEPWMNKNCTDMVIYAHNNGHNISVFTTGIGMNIDDVNRIKNIPFSSIQNGGFVLHLPDKEGYSKHPITDKYVQVLEYIKEVSNEIPNFSVVCMGTVHDRVKHIFPYVIRQDMWSRANNLTNEQKYKPELLNLQFKSVYKGNDDITCGCDEKLYHNVLLPNGDVSLCCMDYGLKHIIGNLFNQEYDDILPKPNTPFDLCKFCENGIKINKNNEK